MLGIEVRPRRAREAFWRCAQALAILWIPILGVDGEGWLWSCWSCDGEVDRGVDRLFEKGLSTRDRGRFAVELGGCEVSF